MKREGESLSTDDAVSKRVENETSIDHFDDTLQVIANKNEQEANSSNSHVSLKSHLVDYDIRRVNPYDGVIGNPKIVTCTRLTIAQHGLQSNQASKVSKNTKSLERVSERVTKDQDANKIQKGKVPHVLKETPLRSLESVESPVYAEEFKLIEACNTQQLNPKWDYYRDRRLHWMLSNQSIFTSPLSTKNRIKLFDWLIDVSHEFHITTEAVILSFTLVEAFLSQTSFPTNRLQCLGSAALHLSCKFLYNSCPTCRMFSDLSLHSFTCAEMNATELQILSVLQFNLVLVTPFDFLMFLLHRLPATPSFVFVSFFLLESGMVCGKFVGKLPSVVAMTCVWEAAKYLHVSCDWDALNEIVQCSVEERDGIGEELLRCPSMLRNEGFEAIDNKYREAIRCSVATLL